MKRKNWIAGEYSARPAGDPNKCFYCHVELGEEHKEDCVIRHRTVVLDFTIRMVVDVPEFWTKEDIEHRYNEGTWCADNLIKMLDRGDGNGCLCGSVSAKYVKEADEQDEDNWGLIKVKEIES